MTSTAFVWPVPRSIRGVTAMIWLFVKELTKASFTVPLPKSKSTRTGPMKFVPLIVMTSPPSGLPVVGVMFVIVGFVDGGGGITGCEENVTVMLFETLFTTAVIVAVPAAAEVSVAVATPLFVVRIVTSAPVSVKVPSVVVNWTAVPFGT